MELCAPMSAGVERFNNELRSIAHLVIVRLDEDVTMNEQTQTSIEADLLQANLARIMSGVSKGVCYFLVCESV